MTEVPKCRGCRKELENGGHKRAYDPQTGEACKWNHFGGHVCCYSCDYNVCLEMLSSFPGAGKASSVPRRMLNDWSDF